MTARQPWFRMYSEAVTDRKLTHIATALQCPRALVLGVWATILAVANDSPERGVLLLASGVPLSVGELEAETGVSNLKPMIELFNRLDMLIVQDGQHVVIHWSERQFLSDSSTERVRKYREALPAPPDEALPERFRNTPDTDTESDTDSLRGAQKTRAPQRARDPNYLPDAETQAGILFAGPQTLRSPDDQLRAVGWNIRPEEVRTAACHFLQATGLSPPADKKTRGDWYTELHRHVENYGPAALEGLYREAMQRCRDGPRPLTISRPGSLTRILPALAAESNASNGTPEYTPPPFDPGADWKDGL